MTGAWAAGLGATGGCGACFLATGGCGACLFFFLGLGGGAGAYWSAADGEGAELLAERGMTRVGERRSRLSDLADWRYEGRTEFGERERKLYGEGFSFHPGGISALRSIGGSGGGRLRMSIVGDSSCGAGRGRRLCAGDS